LKASGLTDIVPQLLGGSSQELLDSWSQQQLIGVVKIELKLPSIAQQTASDLPAITAMFQEDAILMPPNQSLLQGKAAIERFYGGLCHGPVKLTAFTFAHLEARAAGDVAFDIGTYKQTFAVSPGRTVDDAGKYDVILKRVGSEWKIAYLIFNSDLPPQPHPMTANH
jgi:ketosteroid isomerase-like protein